MKHNTKFVLTFLLSFNLLLGVIDNTEVKASEMESSQKKETITLRGKVVDEAGIGLPGTTVVYVEKNTGTVSDFDGNFVIRGATLPITVRFSFVGFITQEFKVTKKKIIHVVMKENTKSIDEVKVVGYGTTTRRTMTGSVSSVKSEELKNIPSTSISGLLQGKVAGMDITNVSGAPGAGGTAITIRGYNNIGSQIDNASAFSSPLWVIDGVPMNSFSSPITGTNMLADLNPDMIESIEVLKDASSASIYGSRAANGVVMVTTKSGKKNQRAKVSVNFSQSYSILPELPTITIGKKEREYRLETMGTGGMAYLDPETKIWKYARSLKDSYLNKSNGHSYNSFWDPTNDKRPQAHGYLLQDSLNSFYNNQNNFLKQYFQKAKVTNANIQVYGGTEKVTYGVGLGYYSEKGILKGTGFDRLNFNSSLNINPFKKMNFDVRLMISFNERNRKSSSTDRNFTSAPAIETIPADPYKLSSMLPGEGSAVWDKVIASMNGVDEKNRNLRIRSNFKASYEIAEGLKISSNLAGDFSYARRNKFMPSTMNLDGWSNSSADVGTNLMLLCENLLEFKKSINEVHNFNFLGGFSYEYDEVESVAGFGQNSPSDDIHYVNDKFPTYEIINDNNYVIVHDFQQFQSDLAKKTMVSAFSRFEYNYNKKYLFSASVRADGVSTFGKNNRWGTFPSFSSGWVFSEENFMEGISHIVDFSKIRCSWGKSGKQFNGTYLADGVLLTGDKIGGETTIVPDWGRGYRNPDLSWEETTQFDIGFDIDLFNYKISLSGDYYLRETDKLLYPVNIPGSFYNGYEQQWRNAASISNSGIEIMLKYDVINKEDFNFNLTLTFAKNWNKFEGSYDDRDLYYDDLIIGKSTNGIFGYKTDGFIESEDEIGSYVTPDGETKFLNGGDHRIPYTVGDYKFVDINDDGVIDQADKINLGSSLPEASGGITSNFRYKDFDLKVMMTYQLGRHIVNMLPHTAASTDGAYEGQFHPTFGNIDNYDFWEKPGDDSFFGKQQVSTGSRFFPVVDRNVENVDWLKIKNVVLGYNLPSSFCSKIGIGSLRAFLSGENLFTFSNYSGIDPETVDIRTGIDSGLNYPLARKYTLGLTVKF